MLNSIFGISLPTEREICATMVLVYNQLAGSETKKADPEILKELKKKNGLFIFKGIFGNNHKQTDRKMFFADDFIRKIWPTLMSLIDEKSFFKKAISEK